MGSWILLSQTIWSNYFDIEDAATHFWLIRSQGKLWFICNVITLKSIFDPNVILSKPTEAF